MKIKSFHTTQLHGYLTFTLTFNSALTFLTGINGSGKTSAVRALTALLSPSLMALADIDYGTIGVLINHHDEDVLISSRKTEEEFFLSLSTKSVEGEALRVPILKPDAYESGRRFQERAQEFYREIETFSRAHPVIDRLSSVPTPMFLDLERRYQDGVRLRRAGSNIVSRALGPTNALGGSVLEGLTSAQSLAEDAHREFISRRTAATDTLKQELLLSPFMSGPSDQPSLWNRTSELLVQLQATETLVTHSLTEIGIAEEEITAAVVPFFERVRAIIPRLDKLFNAPKDAVSNDESLATIIEWSALEPRVKQINGMASRLSEYNTEINSFYARIDRYLKLINQFLSDSDKTLLFDRLGDLRISVGRDSQERDIKALSSGERQLLVILTHLAFNRQARKANILIIDEPELSLHLRWQEMFVDAVVAASPGLQLILATHSPAIIGGRVSSCIDVREEWQNAVLLA